jgi:CelD/BcsL family acetyltransferase involved in cellulose biosynthesis
LFIPGRYCLCLMEQVGISEPGTIVADGRREPCSCPPPADAGAGEWAQVIADAADPNVFAEPWMIAAGIGCTIGEPPSRIITRSADGRASGVAMIQPAKAYGRLPMPHVRLWSHPNCFGATATARAGDEAAMWDALISDIADLHPSAMLLSLPGIVEGSALHRGLLSAALARDLPVATDDSVTRALLATTLDPETYWEQAVRAKKRKELRRQWARLGEEGALIVDRLKSGSDIAPWIEEFLSLELGGWKGANGSALGSAPETAGFFREAMRAAHQHGAVTMTALRIDGRAIAMLVTLLSGRAGFSFKTAFDESYARFSPGVLLQRESLSLLHDLGLDWIDSCAAQDHPMIDSLWTGRRTMLTLALPLPGARNRIAFDAIQAATRLWHGIKPRLPGMAGRSPA